MRLLTKDRASAPESQRISSAVATFGTSLNEVVSCRVCGRTLLAGERSIGFFTAAGEGPFDVCELCVPRAGRYGLSNTPSTPGEVTKVAQRRRWLRIPRRGGSSRLPWRTAPAGVAAIPVGLAAFNGSHHAHMLEGLIKTLGQPRASVVPRSPTDREIILTVAWEIVWYQFRISPDAIESPEGIEARRGTYLSDLPARWQRWNCTVQDNGQVQPPATAAGATARRQGDHA
jgi:hypothetical protein